MLPARRRDGPTTNVRLAPSHKIEKNPGAANSIGARWNARQSVDRARPRELMRDLRHAVPLLKTGYRVAKCADSGDAYFNNVAIGERADSGWRSGCDHIAGFERHHLSYPVNYNINGKDHF